MTVTICSFQKLLELKRGPLTPAELYWVSIHSHLRQVQVRWSLMRVTFPTWNPQE